MLELQKNQYLLEWLAKKKNVQFSGRFGWTSASERERRPIFPRGHHILGNRMRGGEFTRGVHEDLQVRPMDPEERHLTLFPIHHLVTGPRRQIGEPIRRCPST